MSDMVPYVLTQGLLSLPYLIGLIVISVMVRGSARVLGMIGCGVLLIGHVLGSVWSIMLPRMIRELDLPIASASIPSAIFALISGLGMILLICAVVAGRSKQPVPQSPGPQRPGQPYPGQPQPGQQQPGQQQPGYAPYGQQPGQYSPPQ